MEWMHRGVSNLSSSGFSPGAVSKAAAYVFPSYIEVLKAQKGKDGRGHGSRVTSFYLFHMVLSVVVLRGYGGEVKRPRS